jgi:DNA-binding transcriptional MerR regulator
MELLAYPLAIGDVARVLDVSCSRVRQWDAELHPIRAANGRRRYAVAAVEAMLAKRGGR